MEQTHCHYTGLTEAEVAESRKRHGSNVLTPPKKETEWEKFKRTCVHPISLVMFGLLAAAVCAAVWMSGGVGGTVWVMPEVVLVSAALTLAVGFFGGYRDPLFKILITAFVLSMGISIYDYELGGADFSVFFEPIGIIAALLLATGVAYFLERSNEKTFQSLNEVNDDTPVKVVRDNNVSQVPRKDIVVGDIVIVETGDEVPADGELLEALNLNVNESSLTGEPQAYKTVCREDFDKEATYPSNRLMKGTTVIEGYGTARVLAVGDRTECGKVFVAAQVVEGNPTPLSKKLNTLARWITKGSYLVALVIVVGRVAMHFLRGEADLSDAEGWIDFVSFALNTFMIAVTLIVVAVPEGLPMSVTLSLAFSMRKLMKENTLPRTMHACETMGATSVICTDKTGTLTENRMQVHEAWLTKADNSLVAEMIAVNTTADLDLSHVGAIKAIGNPTEGALLLWLHAQGTDYRTVREQVPVVDRLPFSTENKYMCSVVQSKVLGRRVLFVKGAPEILLGISDITQDEKQKTEQKLAEYQGKAMRTLGLAYLELTDSVTPFVNGKLALGGLHFVGVFAISDPVRKEVPDAIRSCIDAGIQVKIVTGDTVGTAKEIGRQTGLWNEGDTDRNILTGAEFAAMTDEELLKRIPDMKIMSRARPNDKERLVRLLKSKDYVVAVTGDGTNDAPALNAADVGLSMGDGTAVAKEASDMTIQDNSFSTIANAVMWGRSLYKNIQRFILFQMTINVVACLVVLVGAFVGTESPLTVTQMLWVNLIMDTFAAIALASLPPAKEVMRDKPRRVTDTIINRLMGRNILGVGGLFTVVLLALLLVMQHADITSVTDLLSFHWGEYNGLSDYELSLFFTLFVFVQFWNLFNAKAFMTGKSAFAHIASCRGFMSVAAVILVGQILIVEFGGRMFNVTPLRFIDWTLIILVTSVVLWIGEGLRAVGRSRKGH